MLETDRLEEQKNYLSSFKWKHTVDPNGKCSWTTLTRPRDDQRYRYNNRRLCCAWEREKQNMSLSSNSYSDAILEVQFINIGLYFVDIQYRTNRLYIFTSCFYQY